MNKIKIVGTGWWDKSDVVRNPRPVDTKNPPEKKPVVKKPK